VSKDASYSRYFGDQQIAFTTYQFSGATLTWWEDFERRRPVGAAPLSWKQFSVLFLEKYVP